MITGIEEPVLQGWGQPRVPVPFPEELLAFGVPGKHGAATWLCFPSSRNVLETVQDLLFGAGGEWGCCCRVIFGGKGEMVFVGWGGKLEFAPESD